MHSFLLWHLSQLSRWAGTYRSQSLCLDTLIDLIALQEYERLLRRIMPACSLVHGRHIDKMFVIMDATGKDPMPYSMARESQRLSQRYLACTDRSSSGQLCYEC